MSQSVVLVNEHDEVIGEMNKFVAHRHPAKLHRAISVWLKNSQDQVLLQQRSATKIVGAGWWGNTVCGNVWPSESYEACAQRRLEVELGIGGGYELSKLFAFQYQAYANETYGEHEIDAVFGGVYDGEVRPNPAEVSAFVWVDVTELKEKFAKWKEKNNYPSAEESLHFTLEELRKKTPPVELELGGIEMKIVPWTVMMLSPILPFITAQRID